MCHSDQQISDLSTYIISAGELVAWRSDRVLTLHEFLGIENVYSIYELQHGDKCYEINPNYRRVRRFEGVEVACSSTNCDTFNRTAPCGFILHTLCSRVEKTSSVEGA
ncbi:hypothetical protein DICVIV_10582 [Dictyocaulus viviparus]|uniref:Uncharacterized protein n=1 Tax=Dictyocaulus viviparus TaxID=29172 RepID=A0A0D8XFH9_DICVI|nr:hypothetical protein DICVIV_10582 [Dictyocaulus viviparus]